MHARRSRSSAEEHAKRRGHQVNPAVFSERRDEVTPPDPSVKRTVLIVDDETILREVLEDVLRDEGFEVLAAADGREAMAIMSERLPDLVLTDIMMPNMDGHELIAAIRHLPRLAHLPVIVISAERITAHSSGAARVLKKPIKLAALLQAISEVIRR